MLMRGKNGTHNNHSSHDIEELAAAGRMVVDPICPLEVLQATEFSQ